MKKTEDSDPKCYIDMKIQSQVLTMYALTIPVIYIITHPFHKLSRRQALKTQQVASYKHREKPVKFCMVPNECLFSSRNNFATVGSFAKISVPVKHKFLGQICW